MPFSPKDILDDKVNFRAVECRLSKFLREGDSKSCRCIPTRLLRPIPVDRIADVLVRGGIAQADADAVVGHTKSSKDGFDKVETPPQFVRNLFLCDKEVRVILRESAHTRHAAEFTRLFPAIDGTKLGKAYRQVAVTPGLRCKNFDMHRAVHWLEKVAVDLTCRDAVAEIGTTATLVGKLFHGVALHNRRKLRVGIVREMSRGSEESDPSDMRCEDLGVTLLGQLAADKILHLLSQDRSFGSPENQALTDGIIDMEEAEFLAKLAVIAFLGLLQQGEPFLKFFLSGKGRAVDALELGIFFIPLIKSACDMGQAESPDLGCVRHMGAGAEIGEGTVAVESDLLAIRDAGDDIELEFTR